MKKFTDKEIEQALKAAEVTLRIEGLDFSDKQKELVKSLLEEEITREEFVEKAKEMAKSDAKKGKNF